MRSGNEVYYKKLTVKRRKKKQKLRIRAGKYNFRARAVKYKLEWGAGSLDQESRLELGAEKHKYPHTTSDFLTCYS